MKKKDTKDLQEELTSAPDLSIFLKENESNMSHSTFVEQLNRLFKQSGMTKAALSKKACTSEVYLYQIFSGNRTPSRDRTLCLCFGMGSTLEDAQELLKQSGYAPLYIRNRRDAIIIYGLSNKMTLVEINERLYLEGESTIC